MSDPETHTSFIKTPKQLIVTVLLAFVVPIIGIVMLVQLVVNRPHVEPDAIKPEAVAARIQPVGRVVFAGTPEAEKEGAAAAAPAPVKIAAKAGPVDGRAIYSATCVACHGSGVAGAPKLGDKAAWAPRIKTGMDTLIKAALNGLNAMPARGGNASLSDAEVRAAVEYMVGQSK